jgi:Zn-dependent protease with chaperone function
MGLLLIISSLLSWPLHWLVVSGQFPTLGLISPYVLLERSETECWLLALSVYTIGVLAIPNLNHLSRGATTRFLIGCLFVQPFLLVIFRWPTLVSNTWMLTCSVSLTALIGMLPGLAVYAQASRSRKHSALSWPVLLVALTVCMLLDLSRTVGLSPMSLRLDAGSSQSVPWGLILTLIASAWLSSLLIPRWFLWTSRSEPLMDGRAEELKTFWRSFHRTSPEVYLWPTGCRFSNAVLVGNMFSKKLLLTDKLLLTFHRRELEWITLHELSHINRCHQLIRLLPTALVIPALYLVLSEAEGLVLLAGSLALFASFAGLIAATCWWTEWDADSQAIKQGCRFYEMDLAVAAEEYSSVLRKLYGSNGSQRTSWTHPSLKHRLAAIAKLVSRSEILIRPRPRIHSTLDS